MGNDEKPGYHICENTTFYCPNDYNCYLNIDDPAHNIIDVLSHGTIYGGNNGNLFILSKNTDSLTNGNIFCPTNGECYYNDVNGFLLFVNVYAQNSNLLNVSGTESKYALSTSRIYCPVSALVGRCIIDVSGTSGEVEPLFNAEIYAVNSFIDVILKCETPHFSIRLYCKSDYSELCDAHPGAFNDIWLCSGIGGNIQCASTPTPQPTTSPIPIPVHIIEVTCPDGAIPTNEPTNQPTEQPTKHPTKQPTEQTLDLLQCDVFASSDIVGADSADEDFKTSIVSCAADDIFQNVLLCGVIDHGISNVTLIRGDTYCSITWFSSKQGNKSLPIVYATCCNSFIQTWSPVVVNGVDATCPSDTILVGCNYGDSFFNDRTCVGLNNAPSTATCYSEPDDGLLRCERSDTAECSNSTYVMTYCNEAPVDYESNPNGRCHSNGPMICCQRYSWISPFARRRSILESSLSTDNNVNFLALNTSYFILNIELNVENILPDPSYILSDENTNIIQHSLIQILKENKLNNIDVIAINDNDLNIRRRMQEDENKEDNWQIDDQCLLEDDSENEYYFPIKAYNTSCNNNTLNIINEVNYKGIECEFTLPDSIVYTWYISEIQTNIQTNCEGIEMKAIIVDENNQIIDKSEDVYLNTKNITNFEIIPSTEIYSFYFNKTGKIDNYLYQNKTYVIKLQVLEPENIGYCWEAKRFTFMNTFQIMPMIYTMSEPSSCQLGITLAVSKEMINGLRSLCEANMTQKTKELFQDYLFKTHSSQQAISEQQWNDLPANNSRRRLLQIDGGGGTCGCGSLLILFDNGIEYLIEPDFPCFNQSIAVDNTQRVFSVGGHDDNGDAINRLVIYQITSKNSAKLIRNTTIDKARYGGMAYYHRNLIDNNEYIIVINGMNHSSYESDSNYWFGDIVIIALNDNNTIIFPKIYLKHNVIDMKPFITETNELWLFGGRNSENATNYIQYIDLNDTLNNKSDINIPLTTIDRMEPMQLNRVIPFVDFPTALNESCIMIWGGQNYLNNEWIDIEVPVVGLQLYCNDLLVAYLENSRRRLQDNIQDDNDFHIIEFTQYDNESKRKIKHFNFTINDGRTNVFITRYNFTNNGIYYKFTTKYKLFLQNNGNVDDLKEALSFFNDKSNYNILSEKILFESKEKYKGWSFGFGEVNISNIVTSINDTKTILSTTQSPIVTTQSPNVMTQSPNVTTPSPIGTMNTSSSTSSTTLSPTSINTGEGTEWWMWLMVVFGVLLLIGVVILIVYCVVKNKSPRNQMQRIININADTDEEDTTLL